MIYKGATPREMRYGREKDKEEDIRGAVRANREMIRGGSRKAAQQSIAQLTDKCCC